MGVKKVLSGEHLLHPHRLLAGNASATGGTGRLWRQMGDTCVAGEAEDGWRHVTDAVGGTGAWGQCQAPEAGTESRNGRSRVGIRPPEMGGRYWDRTSDLLGVNEALSR
jgi:hypothetical protein